MPFLAMYLVAISLLVLAGWIAYAKLSINSERVFWRTLDQSLTTSAVTVQSTQTNNGVTAQQALQYSFGAPNIAHSLTTLKQGKTTVVDEMLNTPTADYTRYVSISTDEKGPNGKPLNFSKAVGVWAKAEGATMQHAFPQIALGTSMPLGGVAFPIANLTPQARAQLVKVIRDNNVYQVNYDSVKKIHQDGRLLYVYSIKINAVAYAKMMKQFAQTIGLHDLDRLDPTSFATQADFGLKLTIDVRSHHVVTAASDTATAATSAVSQTYTSYDVAVTMPLPTKTISTAELQKRLAVPR